MNVILLGFMGTGKTTIGKRLAEHLGWTFTDMDALIEQREGRKISEIFAQEGEPYFRSLEKKLVKELTCGERQVIATGGGVVLDPDNIRCFQACGLCVCLQADEETILQRVRHDAQRPLLEDGPKAKRIRALLRQRRPLDEAIPLQIDTATRSIDDIVRLLAGLL